MRQRVREIGILKAIGASNWRIGLGFGIETLMISLLSAIIGAGLSIFLAEAGITDFKVTHISGIFVAAIGIAIVLGFIASIIPVWYIGRVKPAEVLRNG